MKIKQNPPHACTLNKFSNHQRNYGDCPVKKNIAGFLHFEKRTGLDSKTCKFWKKEQHMIYIGFNTTILWTEKSLTHSLKNPIKTTKNFYFHHNAWYQCFKLLILINYALQQITKSPQKCKKKPSVRKIYMHVSYLCLWQNDLHYHISLKNMTRYFHSFIHKSFFLLVLGINDIDNHWESMIRLNCAVTIWLFLCRYCKTENASAKLMFTSMTIFSN